MFKLLASSILKGAGRRSFAERPSSKKAALKKLQNEAKAEVPVVVTKLPAVGQPLKNVNVFVGKSDPVLLADSEYPDWIWKARGPCRAALRSQDSFDSTDSSAGNEIEELAKLKKYLRMENRKAIRRNNDLLKGTSQ